MAAKSAAATTSAAPTSTGRGSDPTRAAPSRPLGAGPGAGAGGRKCRIVREDPLLERAQLLVRLEPELLVQLRRASR